MYTALQHQGLREVYFYWFFWKGQRIRETPLHTCTNLHFISLDFSSVFPRRRRYLARSQIFSSIAELGKIFLKSAHSHDESGETRSHHEQLPSEAHKIQLDRSSGTCGIGGGWGVLFFSNLIKFEVMKGFPVIRRLRTLLFDPWKIVFIICKIPICIERSGEKKVYSVWLQPYVWLWLGTRYPSHEGLCGEEFKESVGVAQKAKTIRILLRIMLSEPCQPSNLHTTV